MFVREDEVDDVGAVPVLGHAHERLHAVVVAARVEVVLRAVAVERVVPVHARADGDDVGLRVLVHAEREELHQLAGEVLVRLPFDVRVVVEPDAASRAGATSAARGRGSCPRPSSRNSAFCWYISSMSVTL